VTRKALALLGALLATAGCAARHAPSGRLDVVAAENVWGSIAAQLGGDRVSVRSIITSPATDPHDYEPNAADARSMAEAELTIVNGIGYDGWASRLLASDGPGGRVDLDVGDLLGLHDGANPHQWYSPAAVREVIGAIVAGYDKLDPSGSAYYASRKRRFLSVSLTRYDALRAEIRARFAGVPVGYSESIFQPLGESLGLRLLTPYGFAKATAEGSEVSAADKEATERQAREREIAVWVFNSQNVTPEVQQVTAIARAEKIPVATVTETLVPATATFEQWQVAELERLLAALHRATGR